MTCISHVCVCTYEHVFVHKRHSTREEVAVQPLWSVLFFFSLRLTLLGLAASAFTP